MVKLKQKQFVGKFKKVCRYSFHQFVRHHSPTGTTRLHDIKGKSFPKKKLKWLIEKGYLTEKSGHVCQTCLDHAETDERRQLREGSDDDSGPVSFIAHSCDIAIEDSSTPLCNEPSQPSTSQNKMKILFKIYQTISMFPLMTMKVSRNPISKRSSSQMHPIGVSPVAFFWGAILAWGAQAVIWRARPRNAPPHTAGPVAVPV